MTVPQVLNWIEMNGQFTFIYGKDTSTFFILITIHPGQTPSSIRYIFPTPPPKLEHMHPSKHFENHSRWHLATSIFHQERHTSAFVLRRISYYRSFCWEEDPTIASEDSTNNWGFARTAPEIPLPVRTVLLSGNAAMAPPTLPAPNSLCPIQTIPLSSVQSYQSHRHSNFSENPPKP